jgi:hypothetical protein
MVMITLELTTLSFTDKSAFFSFHGLSISFLKLSLFRLLRIFHEIKNNSSEKKWRNHNYLSFSVPMKGEKKDYLLVTEAGTN